MTQVLNSLEGLDLLLDGIGQEIAAADYTTELTKFMPEIAAQEAGLFAGGFDSNVVNWAPLNPSTVKKKGNDQILIKTGALRDSLVEIGGSGNISEVSPREMLFGTSVPYSIFHQTGTSKMPARPPVGLTEQTLDKLCDIVADATVEKLKGSGK